MTVMEKREFVCIGCPLGCNVTVELDGTEIKNITGVNSNVKLRKITSL